MSCFSLFFSGVNSTNPVKCSIFIFFRVNSADLGIIDEIVISYVYY